MEAINWAALAETAKKEDEILPAGEHVVQCISAEWQSTQSGKPMIVSRYSPPFGPYAGITLYNRQALSPESPKAVAIFMRYLHAHGVNPIECGSNEQIVQLLVGRQVSCTIKHDTEYDGLPRAEATAFRAATPGGIPIAPGQMPVHQPQAMPLQPAPQPMAPQPAPQPMAPWAAQPQPQQAPGAPGGYPTPTGVLQQPVPQPQQAPGAPQPSQAVAQAAQQVTEFLGTDPAQAFQQN